MFSFIPDLNILHIFRPRIRIPMSMPHPVRRLFYLLVCNGIDRVRIQVVCSTIMASQSSRLDKRIFYFLVTRGLTYSEPSSTTLSSLVFPEVMSHIYILRTWLTRLISSRCFDTVGLGTR